MEKKGVLKENELWTLVANEEELHPTGKRDPIYLNNRRSQDDFGLMLVAHQYNSQQISHFAAVVDKWALRNREHVSKENAGRESSNDYYYYYRLSIENAVIKEGEIVGFYETMDFSSTTPLSSHHVSDVKVLYLKTYDKEVYLGGSSVGNDDWNKSSSNYYSLVPLEVVKDKIID